MPNIRLGIENENNEKTAHILATQTSQDNTFLEKYKEIETIAKKNVLQRLILKNNKSDEELYNLQYRLTNKNCIVI